MPIFLNHFASAPYHFRIAPFGKGDEATAWLVSFLNVGEQVLSQNDNFLLGGANCSESMLASKNIPGNLRLILPTLKSKHITLL